MGRKHKRLFDQIVTPDNFEVAYANTARRKRRSMSYLAFKEYAALNLKTLREEIADGAYEQGPMRHFWVYEPKPRLISALPFRDRIAQHAVNNVIEPVFEPTFLPYTFACRRGLGTHAGVRHVQSQLRRTGASHFLKTDFSRYFPSIHRPTLYGLLGAKVKCPRTMDLMHRMTAPAGTGIPIGNLISQLFANVYGTLMDSFVHHSLRPLAWARYMDDIVLLGSDSDRLHDAKDRIRERAESTMGMKFSRWHVSPAHRGVNFLGYRIWPRHKLLRSASVTRARKRLKAIRARGDEGAEQRLLGSWRGHAGWADSRNLLVDMEIAHA